MSSSLETKFSGDSKQLEAAYEKIARENVKYREELKKTHEEHKHASEEAESMLDRVGESIGEQVEEVKKLAIEWASVEKAVELASEAYERQIELAERAAQATRGTGAQRAAVIRNLGPISGEERKEFFERAEAIELTRGLNEAEGDQALNYLLSATGGNRDRALQLLDLAGRAVPEGGGDAVGQVGRGIEQVRLASKDQDYEADLGRLFSFQKVAPIKDVENIAAYMVPAIQNMVASGGSLEEGAGLFSAIAKTSGDVEGRRTRTAVTNLQKGLQDFFDPEKQAENIRTQVAHLGSLQIGEKPDEDLAGRVGEFLKSKGVSHLPQLKDQIEMLRKDHPEWAQEFVEQETGRLPTAKSIAGQIHALQQDPQLRQRFLKQFSPEAQARGADIELLQPGSDTAKQFDAATAELQQTDYKAAAGKQLATIASEPTIQRMQQQRVSEAGHEQSMAGDFGKADIGTAMKQIEELLDQTTQGWTSFVTNAWKKHQANARMLAGEDPHKVFGEMARQQVFNLRYAMKGVENADSSLYAMPEALAQRGFGPGTSEKALSGQMSDEELAKLGFVRRTDRELQRKADVWEKTYRRSEEIGRLEEGHEEEATQEATPAETARRIGRAQPSEAFDHDSLVKKARAANRVAAEHGWNQQMYAIDSAEELAASQNTPAQIKMLKREAEELESPGHTQKDRLDAAVLREMLAALQAIVKGQQAAQQQQQRQHTENQTTMRSYGARAGGRLATGREVA